MLFFFLGTAAEAPSQWSWNLTRKPFWISTTYLAHVYGHSPLHEHISGLVANAQLHGIPKIIGTDANSHHTILGSSDINGRYQCLLDFITFLTSSRKEVLDITFIRSDFPDYIRGMPFFRTIDTSHFTLIR